MKNFWDERFSAKEFIYGKEPNNFFAEEIKKLKPGKMISFGEGEGRNAVFAAVNGWEVDAIDFSSEGKKKAELLAAESKVNINYMIHDILEYQPKQNFYDLALIIFFHVEKEYHSKFFSNVISSLNNNGLVLLEVFDKTQLKYNSGGPKSENLMYSLDEVVENFIDFDFIKFSKEIITLNEGKHHSGEASVIRFIGRKVATEI